ncbi:putative glycoside hydrolase [Cavenderia fasciculata]|uniref:Endoglucanase n=1 Tax=Cavenderia fasciculata TaxID=261658 RepID=F4Q7G1_CACFS|nr:putative glycoside hydrolase [Cavenderia fasciculata]EGG16343.1 putative glycoside hydrolase [Cavenderia fasciculata]|eukprot:XP_004354727.1 putative glycoside hydrolase [Cavenderia fasciculata]
MYFKNVLIFMTLLVTLSQSQSTIDYCQLLSNSLKFYKAQRAGSLPDNDIPWRNNSVLQDGQDVGINLSGGYFDAGDYIKLAFPMAFTMTTLAWTYIDNEDKIKTTCQLQSSYLSVLKQGTDWLIAAHPSDNVFYTQVSDDGEHNVWNNPWEIDQAARKSYKITTAAPGTDMAMEAAAALAATSIVYKSIDPTYSATCLAHAKSLYNFGKTYKGKYSDSLPERKLYPSSGYDDEMVWASAWMYIATAEQTYATDATANFNAYLKSKSFTDLWSAVYSWDSKYAPAAVLMYKKVTNLGLDYTNIINQITQTYTTASKQSNGIISNSGWKWGNNRYAMGGAFLMSMIGGTAANAFAEQQLTSVLGKSSTNSVSFMIGYNNGPVNPHHRSSHKPTGKDINTPVNNVNLLVGGLVGGPSLEGSWVDSRTNYENNEPALDYNAGFTGLLARFVSQPSASTTTSTPTSTTSSTTTNTPTGTTSSTTTNTPTSTTSSTTTNTPTSTTSSTTTNTPTSTTSSTLTTSTSSTASSTTTDGEEDSSQLGSSSTVSVNLFVSLLVLLVPTFLLI